MACGSQYLNEGANCRRRQLRQPHFGLLKRMLMVNQSQQAPLSACRRKDHQTNKRQPTPILKEKLYVRLSELWQDLRYQFHA